MKQKKAQCKAELQLIELQKTEQFPPIETLTMGTISERSYRVLMFVATASNLTVSEALDLLISMYDDIMTQTDGYRFLFNRQCD